MAAYRVSPRTWRIAGTVMVLFAVVSCLVLVFRDGGSGDGPSEAGPGSSRVAEQVPVAAEKNASGQDPDLLEGFVPDDTEPEVRPYATGLSGRVHTPRPAPSAPPAAAPGDGCDHAYGETGQCVPWTFPSSVKTVEERCEWLRDLGFPSPLASRGDDRHGLDPDGDGLACET
ncbi:hypothetical protein [Actinocorallia aurantiaca]|jgi:hypothetical protein|uniref:Excalibur calcium-binding domain-containing protein n=1 Tax=Actinocorallia aurantiaca TaxID=46204 RepID=A0ABP6GRD9_9ACTN